MPLNELLIEKPYINMCLLLQTSAPVLSCRGLNWPTGMPRTGGRWALGTAEDTYWSALTVLPVPGAVGPLTLGQLRRYVIDTPCVEIGCVTECSHSFAIGLRTPAIYGVDWCQVLSSRKVSNGIQQGYNLSPLMGCTRQILASTVARGAWYVC